MVNGQTPANQTIGYNQEYWSAYANKLHLNALEKSEFLKAKQHAQKQNTPPIVSSPYNKQANPNQTQAVGCNNIDFETGNTAGWTLTRGFHPIFNASGCCPTGGGQQVVTTGNNATDPFGNFPVVAPGGNFSLKLGNNNVGGEADRIEQTFFVTAANANFTYKYAVVFEDPGHTVAQQPSFVIEMFDTTNTPIPCTYYNVSAGANIPGFLNAANGVVYKPWTNVVVDLTNYIGQNVTIRFTTYDCALGGHFGYAYVDGNCAAFVKGFSDTICVGATKNICAPPGFGSYTWNGPNVNNAAGACLNVSAVGIYSCSTTLVTNCQGPVFTYTINNYPNPIISFTPQTTTPCALQYTFANNSSISSGNIVSYNWTFGNNNTSTLINPINTYTTFGTYPVTLTATSNHSCVNTAVATLTIHPNPVPAFLANPICANTSLSFTNTSSIPSGSITTYIWNFGNNQISTTANPTFQFANSGLYTVSLTAISNQNCYTTYTSAVTVNPVPVVNYTATNVCMGIANNFSNLSTISSGNITNYIWDFNNYTTSTAQNASYQFPTNGTYSVQLIAISNNNCMASVTKTVMVHAIPTANFTVPNACLGSVFSLNNTSTVQDATLTTHSWNFGNNVAIVTANPSYIYNTPGTYTISLWVYSNYNCQAHTTRTVSIYAVPQVNFSSNIACLNQTTQFNNSTIISNGFISKWQWDFENDGIVDDSVSVNPALVYNNHGNYNCKLVATSNHNCANNIINPVIIHPNPIAQFQAKSVCTGDKTEFVNLSSSPSGSIISYQWQYYGDGNVSNVFSYAAHNYSYTGTYLVKLEVQNEFGCVNVLSKPVYVNPKPVAAFSVDKTKGCEALCVTFTNQSSISNGNIATHQWIFGDGSSPSYELNPKHCFKSGKFGVTLKLISDSGCMSNYVNNTAIEVYPKPIASFVSDPSEIDDLEPIANITSDAIGADETRYYINDGKIYLTKDFTHVFTNLDKEKPIIFQVVTNKAGCSDTTSRILNIKPSYAIYIPNTFTPNYDGTNDGFKAMGYNIIKFNLKIFDRWGKLLFETDNMDNAWDGHAKGSSEPIKDDVYVWKASVVDINNKAHDLVGHVTLLK